MVGTVGFEPTASCSQGKRDNQTSLCPNVRDGALEEIRTLDPLIRSQILYPAELRGRKMEVPRGFEPRVGDLQSLALPAWLWNQRQLLI